MLEALESQGYFAHENGAMQILVYANSRIA